MELHYDSATFTMSFSHLLTEPKWSFFTIYVLIGSQNTLKYEDLEPAEYIEVALEPRNLFNQCLNLNFKIKIFIFYPKHS